MGTNQENHVILADRLQKKAGDGLLGEERDQQLQDSDVQEQNFRKISEKSNWFTQEMIDYMGLIEDELKSKSKETKHSKSDQTSKEKISTVMFVPRTPAGSLITKLRQA